MCGVLFCVWRGACVTKIDEDRLQRRDRNKRNVCVLGITFSGEQQENADNSKHDGTRSILPKLRPYIVSSVHLNRRTFYLPRVQRKERGLSPNS